MSAKLVVELDRLVDLSKATESNLTHNARALMAAWIDYARRVAIPMPPPDPPDHGPHIAALPLKAMLAKLADESAAHAKGSVRPETTSYYQGQNSAYVHIIAQIRAALEAQGQAQKEAE